MTTTRKRFVAALVTIAWVYVSAAYVSLEVNPFDWTLEGRFWFAFGGWVAFMVAACPVWESPS